jgi:hypothetical protein
MKMSPPMNSSGHIHSLGYDQATQTLAVRFHSGLEYHYPNVPSTRYVELHSSESPGRYFHRNIRTKFKHLER